jgi:hypothetical protein
MIVADAQEKDIGLPMTSNLPIKKVHPISGRFVVCIDEALAKTLSMDKEAIWLRQELKENAIIMRVHRFPCVRSKRSPSS